MKNVLPELRQAILSPSQTMVDLCEIDHPAGIVRLNSGVLPVVWGGDTFIALGKLGAITGITQSMDSRSQEVVLSMASPTLDETAQQIVSMPVAGRFAWVWRAFLRSDWTVIGEPIQLANITMDALEVVIDESGQQSLQIKGFMTQFAARRVKTVYYSNETQISRFPGDTGLDRMAGLADKEL
jgi:hypothetical protein